ncbi:unnamed protein product [Fraxinus pennsylvanica]|uniref:Serine-threonine/tyrosine-protein kinase catalytic domain-containing protein n=1 Tax=Fraxinus pennsylvanica TaxID=56036 RepID=A0AAD1YTP9_9LAMI|nr:unnamed protein product [Fraxinus pennsylvanica]
MLQSQLTVALIYSLTEPPGADSEVNIYIRLPASELGEKKKKRPAKIIFILTAVRVLISGLICWGMLLKRRLTSKGEERKNEGLELPSFCLATVAAATDNFSSENMIGEGGFGPVYRGWLSDGQGVAVKRLSKTSRQGDERMLIYEYMQNKSLDNFIFDQDKRTILSWPKRFDIIMGIARGFLYLHHDSRIVGGGHDITRTKRVIGTYGYMAPEYAFDGKFSVKSDVFSMGVVLLEIVSGKKNRSFKYMDHSDSLLGHIWLLWKEDKALELMDECLKDSYVESQVKRCIHVGLLCVQKHTEDRPFMSSVLFMLGSDQEGSNLPDPKEPGFFMGGNYNNEETCKPESNSNTVSMTDIEAR